VDDEARAAVGDEGQVNPSDGHEADGHGCVDEYLDGEHGDDAYGDEAAEGVGVADGDEDSADEDDGVEEEEHEAADEAPLMGDECEDEVVVPLGEEAVFEIGAVSPAVAGEAAGCDGVF